MLGIKQKICLGCGILFTPNTPHQKFHTRQCYMKNFRQKIKAQENAIPKWICPKCGHRTVLKFQPKLNEILWREFRCPVCNFFPANWNG